MSTIDPLMYMMLQNQFINKKLDLSAPISKGTDFNVGQLVALRTLLSAGEPLGAGENLATKLGQGLDAGLKLGVAASPSAMPMQETAATTMLSKDTVENLISVNPDLLKVQEDLQYWSDAAKVEDLISEDMTGTTSAFFEGFESFGRGLGLDPNREYDASYVLRQMSIKGIKEIAAVWKGPISDAEREWFQSMSLSPNMNKSTMKWFINQGKTLSKLKESDINARREFITGRINPDVVEKIRKIEGSESFAATDLNMGQGQLRQFDTGVITIGGKEYFYNDYAKLRRKAMGLREETVTDEMFEYTKNRDIFIPATTISSKANWVLENGMMINQAAGQKMSIKDFEQAIKDGHIN
jgi:hypothetical protein